MTEIASGPVASSMRAAVLLAPEHIEVRDVPRPRLRPHEVLVRVRAVGLCGTDLHIFAGHANYHRDSKGRLIPLSEQPQILGHEIAGVVDQVGSDVSDVRIGDPVILDQGRSCRGELRSPLCEYCETGDSHQCEHYREHGITGPPGGMAGFIAVPAANTIRIQTELDWGAAALAEPLGCIVHSSNLVVNTPARYTLDAGQARHRINTVLVCGAGAAGLLFVQYLRNVLGFQGTLLVSEPSSSRRALAKRFGAETLDPGSVDLADAVRQRTGGRLVELLIEASGSGPLFATIPMLVRKQATVLLYGHGHTGVGIGALNGVQFLEPTLITPAGASGGFEPDGRPSTYLRALRLIESGAVDVESLITHRYQSLESISDALSKDQHAPDYVKGIVTL